MVVYFIVGGLIFIAVAAYVFLMLFYPEWVGITGKDTQKELELEELERKEREKGQR